MSRTLVLAGVAVTGAAGYAIAWWLSGMTTWAERRDRDRYPAPKRAADRQELAAQA
jgi:hypothetical protein